MKYNNPLYAALCCALIAFSPVFGMEEELAPMPEFGQQSTIFSIKNIEFEEKELAQSKPLSETEEENNFTTSCKLLPYKLNMLKNAIDKNESTDIKINMIKKDLATLINFIKQKEPQSILRIQDLSTIEKQLENETTDNIKNLIVDWKNKIERACQLTIKNVKAMQSGNIEQLQQSHVIFEQPKKETNWPEKADDLINYLNTKAWDTITKTYILQLLWWNARQMGTGQTKMFGLALSNMNQPLPSIIHNKGEAPYPQFTFQLTKIPNDAVPELKNLLWTSLTNAQKTMINKRKEIERNLSLHKKELEIKQPLSAVDYIKHKNFLAEYKNILLSQDEALKQKIDSTIKTIDNKIAEWEKNKIEKQKVHLEDLVKYEMSLEASLSNLKEPQTPEEIAKKEEYQKKVATVSQQINLFRNVDEQLSKNYTLLTGQDIGSALDTLMSLRRQLEVDSERYNKVDNIIQTLWAKKQQKKEEEQRKTSDLQNEITEKANFLLNLTFFGSNASKKKDVAPQILSNIVFLATNIQKADQNNIALIQEFTKNPIFQRPRSILDLLDEQEKVAFINAGNIISQFFKPTASLQSVAKLSPPQAQQVQISTPTTFIPIPVAQQPTPQLQSISKMLPSQGQPFISMTQPFTGPQLQPVQPPTQNFFTTTIAPLWNQFTNFLSGVVSWVRNLWPWK